MVYGELAKGYPILYGGIDTDLGGHAFVVHGIDDDGLVAVNWGWQGLYDGHFAMDAMDSATSLRRHHPSSRTRCTAFQASASARATAASFRDGKKYVN